MNSSHKISSTPPPVTEEMIARVKNAGDVLLGYAANGRPGLIADAVEEWKAAMEALAARSNQEATPERCIEIIREVRDGFLSEEYAVGQPLSSLTERFACDEAIKAISLEFGLAAQENAK